MRRLRTLRQDVRSKEGIRGIIGEAKTNSASQQQPMNRESVVQWQWCTLRVSKFQIPPRHLFVSGRPRPLRGEEGRGTRRRSSYFARYPGRESRCGTITKCLRRHPISSPHSEAASVKSRELSTPVLFKTLHVATAVPVLVRRCPVNRPFPLCLPLSSRFFSRVLPLRSTVLLYRPKSAHHPRPSQRTSATVDADRERKSLKSPKALRVIDNC